MSKSPPLIAKKVTIPVTVVAPTETPVVPVPTSLNDSLPTSIVYEPSISDDVVDTPDTVTISRLSKEWRRCFYIIKTFSLDGKNSTLDIVLSVDDNEVISLPPIRETLPAASKTSRTSI